MASIENPTPVVIVAGHVIVEPAERAAYRAAGVVIVEHARRAPGCLDVAIGADLVDPARVNLFERWESQAALEAFRRTGPPFEQAHAIRAASAAQHDVARVRPLFGEDGDAP